MDKTTHFSIRNLVKYYNKARVLDIDEMSLTCGQFVALMGKNGSGKSTLMRLLAQQELLDSGEIFFGDQSLRSISLQLNPQMAFLSEDHELPFPVPLRYWVDIHKNIDQRFDESKFSRLTQNFEVDCEKSFHQLSRGQKMKALFCLQAAKLPTIYFLDEITSVLDSGSRLSLMRFLNDEVTRGCLVVMSTNIASEMQGFATDVILLEKGKAIFTCKTDRLEESFQKIRIAKRKEAILADQPSARPIHYNSDGSWTYMLQQARQALPIGAERDSREVTISDVQAYFTGGAGEA